MAVVSVDCHSRGLNASKCGRILGQIQNETQQLFGVSEQYSVIKGDRRRIYTLTCVVSCQHEVNIFIFACTFLSVVCFVCY
jgi:hypothetical protein